MILDQFTLSFVTAVVVVVAGVMYLFETLVRKDGLSGQLWAVAFLAGILTSLSYIVWAIEPGAYMAVGVGNASFVASAGFIWLGCLAFNRRAVRVGGIVIGVLAGAALIAVLVEGSDGGDWAGGIPMFVGTGICALLGAVESRRAAMGRRVTSWGLTVVLAVEGVWFLARAVVFATAGPDSAAFRDGFSTTASSLLTIVLTLVAVVVTSVLRANESKPRGDREVRSMQIGVDGVMLPSSFRSSASAMLERAARAHETVCLVALRIDDLPRIATAFGSVEAERVESAWRVGVRRYAPTASLVGESESGALLIAFLTTSFADVRRMASIMHRRLIDDFAGIGISVMPVVGVGIALSDQVGHDFAALARAAEDAAVRSETSSDASVIIAEG